MPTPSSGPGSPNTTRQQLDELDALLQRMLNLPLSQLDEEMKPPTAPPPSLDSLESKPSSSPPRPKRPEVAPSSEKYRAHTPAPATDAGNTVSAGPATPNNWTVVHQTSSPGRPPASPPVEEASVPFDSTYRIDLSETIPSDFNASSSFLTAWGNPPAHAPTQRHQAPPVPTETEPPQEAMPPRPPANPMVQAPVAMPVPNPPAPDDRPRPRVYGNRSEPVPPANPLPQPPSFVPTAQVPLPPPIPAATPATMAAHLPVGQEVIPPLLWPLALINRSVDGVLDLFGAPGRFFQGHLGRNLLGWAGFLMLVTACGWGLADWLGLDWTP